ncbi:MAG: ROK family protein [Dehalococcoidales bacterium]|nr:ROK family protein [Dehalococcoidales bacterium]
MVRLQKSPNEIYSGIEAGGTKFICAVGTNPQDLIIKRIETTTPQKTIEEVIKFFKSYTNIDAKKRIASLGIASFGPLDLNKKSPKHGYITKTPKPGWSNVNLAGKLSDALGIPVAIDTDVNGAALGEQEWGVAKGLDTFIYITLGTGIGGGGVINGGLMHGLVHPEMGHIRIPLDKDDIQDFKGSCRFHKCVAGYGCWEGLASGKAMQLRWGKPPEKILKNDKDYHRAWELEANYIALGVYNLICTLSPQRIILGGGIMGHPGLLEKVQGKVEKLLGGYISALDSPVKFRRYIVRPALVNKKSDVALSGVLGAIVLAKCMRND